MLVAKKTVFCWKINFQKPNLFISLVRLKKMKNQFFIKSYPNFSMKKFLHVICFDNPYPANYGGAIDMYYKLKEMKNADVFIILHVFIYKNKAFSKPELLEIADVVHYYTRKTGLFSNLNTLPYIVYSRRSKGLLNNLLLDNHPILFEGLHSCFLLNSKELSQRIKLVRAHNIEHQYYNFLSVSTHSLWKKLYYKIESIRLKFFESNLSAANTILAISSTDKSYFDTRFKSNAVELLPCFTNTASNILAQSTRNESNYFLYHGNLAVVENEQAVLFLIEKVLPLVTNETIFKIAGNNPTSLLKEKIMNASNVVLIQNPDDKEIHELIANAKANVLITFQPTGIKLKLLNALYQGGFCIVNRDMIQGTDLNQHCIEANSPASIALAIDSLNDKEFSLEAKNERLSLLSKMYSNSENVKLILNHL